ncbi:hypothetical protein GCM10027046_04220 [Uliginosibacterium flavum]|uniref:HTH cro/C1-type domain-containing protein n=1 Tax=Uliginosibacterium flavum TaxID=1396831 RepID=A0ABV2TJA6_9RHOO
MKPSELVRKAMEQSGAKSAYALAKVTGISEDSLKNYEKDKVGKNGISNEFARRLAEAAGLSTLKVIAELEMERAKDDATRTAWGKALASIRTTAVILILALTTAIAALSLPDGALERFLRRLKQTIIFIMLSCAELF